MELVENLLSTSQSEDLKSSCVYKLILRTVSQPMNSQECRKTFFKLTEWIISSEYKFLRENALQGFDVLAENSSSVFLEIVNVEYVKMIFANMKLTKPINLICLVITIFSKLSKHTHLNTSSADPVYSAVRTSLVLYLAHHGTNTIFLQSMEHLFTMFPTLLPVSSTDITQLGNVVIHQHSSHPTSCQCDTRLDKLLNHVWSNCTDTTACLNTLHTVFQVLSTNTNCPPACIAAILEAFPRGLLEQSLTVLLDQPPERLLLLLTRLFGWLQVRSAPDLTDSVLKLLSVLGSGRGSLVVSLSQTCLVHLVQQVMEVVSTTCRDQLVMLVLAMLYGGQQSPAPFQSVIPLLPEVLSVLGVDSMWEARDSLLECSMYHSDLFPGVLAGSALECVLQQENMAKMTPERRHQLSGFVWAYPGNFKLDRMPGQLVGLFNLGNTCYMNSVMQALFCTRMFQSQVMATRKRSSQPVLVSLQRVFRSLKLSKRSSISPRQFLDISRPPWFDVGQQQDCSEFLTFLLHSLEVEDKLGEEDDTDKTITDMQWENCAGDDDGKTVLADDQGGHDSGVDSGGEAGHGHSLVQAVFGGKLATSFHCLDCSHTSQGTTSFTDLTLAIPSTRQAQSKPDLPNLPNITITRARHQLTVKDLLKNYLEPEDLCGDNQYQCDKCEGLRDAVKTTQIKAAPKHLIITLLRFKFDASTCQKVKLLTSVDCPESLSVTLSGGEVVRYQLYCVVIHSGQSSEVGHYYSWVRGRQGVEWHKVSDEDVVTVPGKWDQEVQSRRDTPYMLFYQRG